MIDAHRCLVFAPQHNTKGRKDATGAFIPEAKRFMKRHGIPPHMFHLIDNSRSKAWMRAKVLEIIDRSAGEGLRGVAFFCHGHRLGIQFGFHRKTVDDLAYSISNACHRDVRVPLYACDTGRDADRQRKDDLEAFGGDGGFADLLRDALCEYGAEDCMVWAHTTLGHTDKNSHTRLFPGLGSPMGDTGGFYVIHFKKRKPWRKWQWLLRKTDLRFDFPFMEIGEIHRYVLKHLDD